MRSVCSSITTLQIQHRFRTPQVLLCIRSRASLYQLWKLPPGKCLTLDWQVSPRHRWLWSADSQTQQGHTAPLVHRDIWRDVHDLGRDWKETEEERPIWEGFSAEGEASASHVFKYHGLTMDILLNHNFSLFQFITLDSARNVTINTTYTGHSWKQFYIRSGHSRRQVCVRVCVCVCVCVRVVFWGSSNWRDRHYWRWMEK